MSRLVLILIFILISCDNKKSQRKISSLDKQVEIGKLSFAIKKINKTDSLILIGRKCQPFQAVCFNWNNYGFKRIEGANIQHLQAKFLITMSNGVLEDAYTFEFGNTSKKKVYKNLESSDEAISHYIKLPKKIKKKLPKFFLNISEAKKQRKPYSLMSYILNIINFTSLSPFSETIQEIIELVENRKVYQASYLNRIIELILIEKKYPKVMALLGQDQILSIGSALRIRYRGQITRPITSLGTNDEQRNEYYKDHIEFLTQTQSINMSKLVQRANEENFVIKVITRDLAIVFYNPLLKTHPNGYDDLLLNTKDSPDKRYTDTKKLVPLGIFTMSDTQQPTQVLDFENNKKILKNERVTKFLDYGLSIGFGFISNGLLSTTLKVGKFATKLVLKKTGKVYSNIVIESEATLRALLDAGLIELDHQQISVDYFIHFLKETGVSDKTLSYFNEKLLSKDPKTISDTMNEIIELFNLNQTSRRFLSGLDKKRMLINRVVATLMVDKFLKDKESLQSLSAQLAKKQEKRKQKEFKRKKESKKRNPSSIDQNSAIVFMIDGLRPDRFKEAINKGLMPNSKKYFIESGIEFNSFTTKSLTLPSWASVLTGHDIDRHGVRSNGPMNRYHAKPQQNYIDPRKDLLRKKYRQESRSLKHLKESGLKWLPDYFEKEEVITNYLPINQEAFPAVGKMIKILIKEFDKVLFKVFSGSIALDRSGAMQTAQKIKKYPGKTKLVLNWYSCVDVFAHHNNIAIDTCYKELDKTMAIILEAAAKDPILSNAHLFIVSDHGHTGGHESKHSHYKLFKEGSYFNNTSLNLTTLFAGDYANYPHFNFFPFVMESPHYNNDLKFLNEYLIHPFRYKYKSRKKRKKYKNRYPDIMIDYSGDSMASIYLAHEKTGWGERLSFYDISNYRKKDIFEQLLNVKVRNLVIYDQKTKKEIEKRTKKHPIMGYAHALESCSASDIRHIIKEDVLFKREPIIVKGLNTNYSLIVTKEEAGKLKYKYFLLSEFSQSKNLKCSGKLSQNSSKDIFSSYDTLKNKWLTKKEFVYLMRNTRFPTFAISLVSNLTLADELKDNVNRKGELPDFLLLSNLGFNFNSAAITEADHGNLTRREVTTSFFVSHMKGLEVSKKVQSKIAKEIVFNSYITPFVLDVTKKKKQKDKNWPSLDLLLQE
ncbi:MAG: alkaline phosphatase family protein [Bacteriovoracaceae bacterium]|jgi:hypothetical protein|nr:alkaline phosphatase family protein [Bacteriovoracaceae bacterium]